MHTQQLHYTTHQDSNGKKQDVMVRRALITHLVEEPVEEEDGSRLAHLEGIQKEKDTNGAE